VPIVARIAHAEIIENPLTYLDVKGAPQWSKVLG
jgi:hypothetical protein